MDTHWRIFPDVDDFFLFSFFNILNFFNLEEGVLTLNPPIPPGSASERDVCYSASSYYLVISHFTRVIAPRDRLSLKIYHANDSAPRVR